MGDKLPLGQRFSQVYLQKDKNLKDSKRFRKRLGYYYSYDFSHSTLPRALQKELAVDNNLILTISDVEQFIQNAAINDVLDMITILYKLHKDTGASNEAKQWINIVERVFKEEGLGYRVDSEGGVHFFTDEEFESNRLTTIATLGNKKYNAVKSAFEASYHELDSDPPDTKNAIRMVFEATEILYKLLVNAEGKDRLNSHGVKNKLIPIAEKIYSNDKTELVAAKHLLDGLCDWIDACHMYRHGQKEEELTAPPVDFAVNIISIGASYIRLLTQLDSAE